MMVGGEDFDNSLSLMKGRTKNLKNTEISRQQTDNSMRYASPTNNSRIVNRANMMNLNDNQLDNYTGKNQEKSKLDPKKNLNYLDLGRNNL